MMLFTNNRTPYELRRRLGHQGLLQALVCNQAGLGGGYWKKKKIRKHRKLKKKKRTSFQSEERKEKLLDFNILQANVCGLDKKKTQLAKIMEERNVHIALFQETLHSSCDVNITGYTAFPCKCQGCRGIITYIR